MEGVKITKTCISNKLCNLLVNSELHMNLADITSFGLKISTEHYLTLYSMKQKGNKWMLKMWSVFETIGYSQFYSDAIIYIYFKNNIRIILSVFVHNITFVFKSAAAIN